MWINFIINDFLILVRIKLTFLAADSVISRKPYALVGSAEETLFCIAGQGGGNPPVSLATYFTKGGYCSFREETQRSTRAAYGSPRSRTPNARLKPRKEDKMRNVIFAALRGHPSTQLTVFAKSANFTLCGGNNVGPD